MIELSNTEHWLVELNRLLPEKTAVVLDGEYRTFKDLSSRSTAVAKYFSGSGIKFNDNVCILSDHSYEFWIAVNALWLLGAVPVPLNSRNTNGEIEWQLKKVESKFLIIINQSKTEFQGIKKITLNSSDYDSQADSQVHSKFDTLHSALILFTSGSTGKPKAVVHTFKSLLESVKATDSAFKLSSEDIWLASLPLYHIGGFMILVRSLLAGSAVVFPKTLKHNEILKCTKQFGPSHVSFVSTALKRLLDENEQSYPKLKYAFIGGGPLPVKICEEAISRGFPVVKVYGSTETCSMICALKPEEFVSKPNSAGLPLSEKITIKIKNDIMSKIESGDEAGEILVASPTLFKQYYNEEYSSYRKPECNFYNTGDLGRIDNEGFLFIESRREDIIVTGGENVSAKEVEEALNSLHGVEDNYVFGIEDENWGQLVCAAVVSGQLSQEEIVMLLKEKLAGFKIPKKFFFVDEIPRTELGKVKRADLLKILNLDEV
jgi:O-succinylbenzoic acid--CoA ligase